MYGIDCIIRLLQSYTSSNAFILTQYPLKDTEIDLWRLCVDHDVHALVILDDTGKVMQCYDII